MVWGLWFWTRADANDHYALHLDLCWGGNAWSTARYELRGTMRCGSFSSELACACAEAVSACAAGPAQRRGRGLQQLLGLGRRGGAERARARARVGVRVGARWQRGGQLLAAPGRGGGGAAVGPARRRRARCRRASPAAPALPVPGVCCTKAKLMARETLEAPGTAQALRASLVYLHGQCDCRKSCLASAFGWSLLCVVWGQASAKSAEAWPGLHASSLECCSCASAGGRGRRREPRRRLVPGQRPHMHMHRLSS